MKLALPQTPQLSPGPVGESNPQLLEFLSNCCASATDQLTKLTAGGGGKPVIFLFLFIFPLKSSVFDHKATAPQLCCNTVFFVVVLFPLAWTRWVGSTFSSLCPLSSYQRPWFNLCNINNFSSEKKLGRLRIKPGAAGWEASMLPLCYAAPLDDVTLFIMCIEARTTQSLKGSIFPGAVLFFVNLSKANNLRSQPLLVSAFFFFLSSRTFAVKWPCLKNCRNNCARFFVCSHFFFLLLTADGLTKQ